MELISIDKYLELPREQAYNRHLDEKNLNTFRITLWIFIIIYSIAFVANIFVNGILSIVTGLIFLNLLLLIFFKVKYFKLFSLNNIRRSAYYFLLSQLLFSVLVTTINIGLSNDSPPKNNDPVILYENQPDQEQSTVKSKFQVKTVKSYTEFIFMFGLLILFFRFSKIELVQLYSIAFFIPILMEFIIAGDVGLDDDIPNIILSLIFFIIAYTSEKKRRQKFIDQYEFYRKKNVDNLRMRKELNYAREIQLSMLPVSNITLNSLEISAVSLPATEVGGDYFDYFEISKDKIGLFICDVSGHGVASGLLLSGLRSCMHLILEDDSNPKSVMEKLNRMIRKTQNRKMFVTAIFAAIDLKKNRCTLFNAGHMPPYRISGESGEIFRIRKHGVALGVMDTVEIEDLKGEVSFDFQPGDKIIFYTDGVNESSNKNSDEFGFENLEMFFNENMNKSPRELISSLVSEIKKFTGDISPKDDLTIMIAERKP